MAANVQELIQASSVEDTARSLVRLSIVKKMLTLDAFSGPQHAHEYAHQLARTSDQLETRPTILGPLPKGTIDWTNPTERVRRYRGLAIDSLRQTLNTNLGIDMLGPLKSKKHPAYDPAPLPQEAQKNSERTQLIMQHAGLYALERVGVIGVDAKRHIVVDPSMQLAAIYDNSGIKTAKSPILAEHAAAVQANWQPIFGLLEHTYGRGFQPNSVTDSEMWWAQTDRYLTFADEVMGEAPTGNL